MSGGSQHNPNGRQSQLGAGWSPLQLQMASYLARAPQAHMASERGVTWHTPTPPHLYHVPAPSPPDPLQAMKASAASNSVFRHTATPPDLYRHTPTPPDKHLMRHTPSPGDAKAGASMPPADIYSHLIPAREKLRAEELVSYGRGGGGGGGGGGGVDLSLGRATAANGSPIALSVRDAPTINSLIARAQPRHPHARVDSLLERLAPSPVSPHSVIVHARPGRTPSPPSSNEDTETSCGVAKRKRKPDRVVRMPVPPPEPRPGPSPPDPPPPLENGASRLAPEPPEKREREPAPHTRRKTRSGSAETIDDIAAMIAGTEKTEPEAEKPEATEAPVTVDRLKSVLASPEPEIERVGERATEAEVPPKAEETAAAETAVTVETAAEVAEGAVEGAAAPRRRSARTSRSESTNVPVASPSEAKSAEPDSARSEEPVAASIVEVEDQLEKMFAGIEEVPENGDTTPGPASKKRRRSAPNKSAKKWSRRSSRASTGDERGKQPRRRVAHRAHPAAHPAHPAAHPAHPAHRGKTDAGREYDSGSNASSGRSRGPYIQIRGPRDSPLSVSVINATTGDEETDPAAARRRDPDYRNGLRARGLHCSTLGLRYDATTPDASWLCEFCNRGPHAAPPGLRPLGDLFGPYAVGTDCDEYRALDEPRRRLYRDRLEVWLHEECAVWAGGLLARGARLWGLPAAVWGARAARCGLCTRPGAALACAAPRCRARLHLPCASSAGWQLLRDEYRALCADHRR